VSCCGWRSGVGRSRDDHGHDDPSPGRITGGPCGTARGAAITQGVHAREKRRKGFGLRTGPCRALGADAARDAELRGDLACRRLGSERKYVKRVYARDTGKAGGQFAR
jgi:hypothetical protein